LTGLVLRGGRLWDGIADGPVEGAVAIEGSLIAGLGPDASGAQALDISGCTALPGLIEGHAHLCFNAARNWRAVYDGDSPGRMLLRMAANGRSMLEAGITTVRDLGAPTSLAIEAREAFRDGVAPGPDLLVAGAPITTEKGHCWFMGGCAEGQAGIREAVRQRVTAGVDWIKVMATGGNMTPGTNTFEPQYSVDELRACVEEAHRLERRVTAHCHGIAGVRLAVEAGVDMIEHCTFSTPEGIERDDELIGRIARAGTVVSPTVSIGYRLWADDGRRARRGEILRAVFGAGCRVIASTDCGIPQVPHNALWQGLDVLAELAGLKPVEALRLATSRSAELLGLADRGRLAPGLRADLVVVEGDPARGLAALGRVRYVLKAGEVVFAAPPRR
jgi:imidazolonepropionase-like amidohydrolase